jgi:hypothetical protein
MANAAADRAPVGLISFYDKPSDSEGVTAGQVGGGSIANWRTAPVWGMSDERFDAGDAQRCASVTNVQQTNGANHGTPWPVRRAAPRRKHRAPTVSTPSHVRQTRLPTE